MNLSNVDLNLLKVFEALYIERNVTRAAVRLGIAQSSLSSSLKRLRELFHDELFVRSSKGMMPTKRALSIESNIIECLNSVREAIIVPQKFDPTSSTRTFVIGGSDFSAFTILPELIRFLRKTAPQMRLEMRPIPPNETIDYIEGGRVDFAISSENIHPKKIFRKLLFSEDMAVIVGRNNALHQPNKNLTLKKYAELQHIYITSKGEGEKMVDQVLKKNSLKREIYLTVQSFLIVPFIVENSDLIATVSERVATQCSQQSKLCIYPFPSKIEKNKFHILWGKSANSDQECQWLIDSIVDLLAMTDKPHA